MAWVAVATIGSSALGYMGAQSSANAQVNAARQSADAQKYALDKQLELQEPFRQAGLTAQNKLMSLLGLGAGGGEDYGKYARDFGQSDFTQDPGYQFRLSEGLKALDRTAAARGGLLSGATMKAVQDYGQNAASQEYQNAFNRYQVNRSNQLNPLQSLAGQGQSATNTLGGAYGNYGQSMGNIYGDIGNAQAAGTMGGINALTGGLSTYLNYNQSNNLLNALRGQSASSYIPPDVSGGRYIGPSYLRMNG